MLHFSLSKTERLSSKSYIKQAFKQGRRFSYMGATLFVIPNKLDHNRFLCTFRRGFKGAVLRNRVRRLSKEVYRLNKCMLKQGFDVVLLVSASDSDFCVLKERMFALFRMARLFISEAS